jgi:hypothetical protein
MMNSKIVLAKLARTVISCFNLGCNLEFPINIGIEGRNMENQSVDELIKGLRTNLVNMPCNKLIIQPYRDAKSRI